MDWDLKTFDNCFSQVLKKDSILDLDIFTEKYHIRNAFLSIDFLNYFFIEISKNNSLNIAIYFFDEYEKSNNENLKFVFARIVLYNSLLYKNFNFTEYFLERIKYCQDLYCEQLNYLLLSFSSDNVYLKYRSFCVKYIGILFENIDDDKKLEFINNLEDNKQSFFVDIVQIDKTFIFKYYREILEKIKLNYYNKKKYFETNQIMYDRICLDKIKNFYNNVLFEFKKIGLCVYEQEFRHCFQLQLIFNLNSENIKLKNSLNKLKYLQSTCKSNVLFIDQFL